MVEKKFLQAVKKFSLIDKKDKILIAFSGGVDSSVLTYLLKKFQSYLSISEIALAHLNHQLRDKDSDLDEHFAIELARKLDIPVYTKRVNIKYLSQKEKKSIEEIAREERYKFFHEIMEKYGFNKLATGHHLSDLAETMLLWFIQGNKRGAKGFQPKEKHIIRPLYLLRKEEIIEYAYKKGISYRVDKTNFQTDFLRNKVRHHLIPVAKEINPSLENSLLFESFFMTLDEKALDEEAKKVSQKFLEERIPLDKLLRFNDAVVYRVLRNWVYSLTGEFLSYKQLYEIMDIIKKKEGSKFFYIGSKYILTKSYNTLSIKRYNKETSSYLYEIKPGEESDIKEVGLKIVSFKADENFIQKNIFNDKKVVCFDFPEENPVFKIRPRKKGDKFLPFGRKTEKKLKDVMIDLKIPKDMRDTIPLLTYGDKILWIIGYKRSGYFPVKEQSKNIICFKIEEV